MTTDGIVGSGDPPDDRWGWLLWAAARIRAHTRGHYPWFDMIWNANPHLLDRLVGVVLVGAAHGADDPDIDPLEWQDCDRQIQVELRRMFFARNPFNVKVWQEKYRELDDSVPYVRKHIIYLLAMGMGSSTLSRLLGISRQALHKKTKPKED